jgi:hypothetical protein
MFPPLAMLATSEDCCMEHPRTDPWRRTRLVQGAILLVLVVTAGTVWRWWPMAWAPAALAAILYAMYAMLMVIDRVAHASPAVGEGAAGRARSAERSVAWKTALTLFIGLAAIATVIASALLDARTVAIGALMVFAMAVFMGMPMLALTVTEEMGAVRDGADGERMEHGPPR